MPSTDISLIAVMLSIGLGLVVWRLAAPFRQVAVIRRRDPGVGVRSRSAGRGMY